MQPLHVPPTEKDAVSRSLWNHIPLPKFLFPSSATSALAIVSMGIAAPLQAGLVYWGSEGFTENSDSRHLVWTADFTMALGVFNAGFVPSQENREQWTANWSELSVATFHSDEARFAGVVDVSQALPAGSDSQVYFWAKNGTDLTKGPEWLLVTRPDWQWPASSGAAAPALTWTTGKSTRAVVGLVGVNGFHLTSERVAPLPVTREQWLAGFFPNSIANRDPDADPDGDGIPNRLEYFLGSDPSDAASRVCPEIRCIGDGTTLTLQKNPLAPSSVGVETSSNLEKWTLSDPQVVQDRPDLLEVRFPAASSGEPLFFRFKLEEVKP